MVTINVTAAAGGLRRPEQIFAKVMAKVRFNGTLCMRADRNDAWFAGLRIPVTHESHPLFAGLPRFLLSCAQNPGRRSTRAWIRPARLRKRFYASGSLGPAGRGFRKAQAIRLTTLPTARLTTSAVMPM